jgi:hypothetical protein
MGRQANKTRPLYLKRQNDRAQASTFKFQGNVLELSMRNNHSFCGWTGVFSAFERGGRTGVDRLASSRSSSDESMGSAPNLTLFGPGFLHTLSLRHRGTHTAKMNTTRSRLAAHRKEVIKLGVEIFGLCGRRDSGTGGNSRARGRGNTEIMLTDEIIKVVRSGCRCRSGLRWFS